jgi:polyferredoxin
MKPPKKRKPSLRLLVQIFFFVLIALISVNKGLEESGKATIPFLSTASLHSLCPFGGVVTLYNLITVGTLIQKIHASAVVLLALILLLTVLFGPVFCGWVCPLGSIQECIGKLGKRLFKKRYNRFVPRKLDKVLRYFRFVVLVWVVFVTARSATLLFANVDPYNALFTFWYEEVSLPAMMILGVTLLGSLFIERPWCKYACPYGALLGLFNKIRIFKIRRAPSTCIACNRCTNVCPMNIDVAKQETVTDLQCISCLECTSERACPVEDIVEMSLRLKRAAADAQEAAQ